MSAHSLHKRRVIHKFIVGVTCLNVVLPYGALAPRQALATTATDPDPSTEEGPPPCDDDDSGGDCPPSNSGGPGLPGSPGGAGGNAGMGDTGMVTSLASTPIGSPSAHGIPNVLSGGPGDTARGEQCTPTTSHPVVLHTGAVHEAATDLVLPGPLFTWRQSRSYNSAIQSATPTHLGRNWISSNGGVRLIRDTSTGDVRLISGASSQRTFKSVSSAYQAPAGSDLTLTDQGALLKLVNESTGDIWYFHDFGLGVISGRLYERTTRSWDATSGKVGDTYAYDSLGRLESITTASGQDTAVGFRYVDSSSWWLDKVIVGSTDPNSPDVFMEVDYTYQGEDLAYHSDLGADDDLVQVNVRRKSTDGNWIERITQYRYFSDGKLKAVLEPDAVQRIIDLYSGIASAADILTHEDAYFDSGHPPLDTMVSRSFTYFPSATTTGSLYGGQDMDETGRVQTETVFGSHDGAGCCGGGGAGAGVTMHYQYLEGASASNYSPSDPDANPLTAGHINIVYYIVVEDIKQGSNLLRRNIYGLSKNGMLLRHAVVETANGSTFWCMSQTFRNDRRVLEKRLPSAHVDSSFDINAFLDPYDGSSFSETLNADGLIYVYEYNNAGWPTGKRVKRGSGDANYVSAIDYGDGSSDASWHQTASIYYPTPTIDRNESDRVVTAYDYEYYSGTGFDRIEKVTVTAEAVPSGENGSGQTTSAAYYYDSEGRLRWTKDGEGYVNYYSYHPQNGALTYQAIDVDPAFTPATSSHWLAKHTFGGTRDPSLTTYPAASLITTVELDNQGRPTKVDDRGRLHFARYHVNETLRFSHVDSGGAPLLPIEVTRTNDAGVVVEAFSVKPSAATEDDSVPTGYTAGQGNYLSWSRMFYDPHDGRPTKTLVYHDIPGTGEGDPYDNYHVTAFGYDNFGRRTQTIRSVADQYEQLDAIVYDFLDRPTTTQRSAGDLGLNTSVSATVGSIDTGGLMTLTSTTYDDDDDSDLVGDIGDGHVSSRRRYHTATTYTDTIYHRTFRGFLRGVSRKYTDGSAADVTPYQAMNVDWLGRTTESASYTTQPTWSTLTAGLGDAAAPSTDRFDRHLTKYDILGRVYQSEQYPGTSAKRLQTNNYYDRNGRLVCTGDKYSAHTEYAYDGAGRRYSERTVKDVAATKYSSGAFQYRQPAPTPVWTASGGNDDVIEIAHTEFDAAGNAIMVTTAEINHNDANGIDLGSTSSYVRQTIYHWYDAADRRVATAEFGTGQGDSGSTAWKLYNLTRPSRPGTAPTWTDSLVYNGYALLSSFTYDEAGRQDSIAVGVRKNGSNTDKMVTKTFYDDLGRRTHLAENFVDFAPGSSSDTGIGGGSFNDQDRVTKWEYDGLGNVRKLNAYNLATTADDQITEFQYTDPVHANLVRKTIYPDGDSSTDNVQQSYNLDGSLATLTDQRGVVHQYSYNNRRQLEWDKATTIPTGVDDSIQGIQRTYDSRGRLEYVRSYPNTIGSGTPANQVQHQYWDVGQADENGRLYVSHQAHGSATGLQIGYRWDESATSNIYHNGLRLWAQWAHNGWAPVGGITYRLFGSDSGPQANADNVDDRLHRVSGLQFDADGFGGTAAVKRTAYKYNGTNRLAEIDYPTPLLRHVAYNTSSVNEYSAWDRFGRKKLHLWFSYSTGGPVRDWFDYAYDYAGNRLSRNARVDLINGSAPDERDQDYDYDGLMRLADADQGTASNTTGFITTQKTEQRWSLDALGNWSNFKYDTNGDAVFTGGSDLDQTRLHNQVNEIDNNSDDSDTPSAGTITEAGMQTQWATPDYDRAGNMTTMPKPAAPASGLTARYDAWNRLITLVDPSVHATAPIAKYEYDGLNRRIVKQTDAAGDGTIDETRHFYYTQDWHVIEERVETGGGERIDAAYVWNPEYIDSLALRHWDTPGSSAGPDTFHYFLHDANYNVTAVSNSSGAVVERYAYTPYGEATVLNGASDADSGGSDFSLDANQQSDINNIYLYTGRERDPETGLQLNRYRYYAANMGRWLTRDPIGYLGSRGNIYEYTSGRVLNGTDPLGLAPPWLEPIIQPIKKIGGGIKDKLDESMEKWQERIDNMTVEQARQWCEDWHNKEQKAGSDWMDTLPKCPCTQKEAGANNNFKDSPKDVLTHPGCTTCFRSGGRDGLLDLPHPGQQCCYDEQGRLITSGTGAGTVDRYASAFPLWHFHSDVVPYLICKKANMLDDYVESRPNDKGQDRRGNPCPDNPTQPAK